MNGHVKVPCPWCGADISGMSKERCKEWCASRGPNAGKKSTATSGTTAGKADSAPDRRE